MGESETAILLLDSRAIAPNSLNLSNLIQWVKQHQTRHEPIIWLHHPNITFESLPKHWQQVWSIETLQQCLNHSTTPNIAYVPVTADPLPPLLPFAHVAFEKRSKLSPWLPTLNFPLETAQAHPQTINAWVVSRHLLQPYIATLFPRCPWHLLDLVNCLEIDNRDFDWHTIASPPHLPIPPSSHPPISPACPSVLALIPHYRCEPWLARCLRAITTQTQPLDGIVVIDDHSPQPPIDIVSAFPTVTLLQSSRRVGPYRLVQQVIETTDYDWYLFQDADDWSTCDRVAHLLHAAETTRAELVGSQEIRVEAESGQLYPVTYPLDVNQALLTKPGHPLLHPTSLVARSLVMRLGGFATGLRFGGDTEFLLRAVFATKIVNIPDFSYFRQKRPDSLTTDPATDLDSPARQALLTQIKQRAIANRMAVNQGRSPQLAPLTRQPSVELRHCCGPRLVQIPNP
ncbi:MAG: glycosyltransferase family A protein [Cyanobacteria bacterium J06639_16]